MKVVSSFSLFVVVATMTTSDAFTLRSPTLSSSSSMLKMSHDLTNDAFCVGVLGDLHIDPRKMEDYEVGRDQWKKILEEESQKKANGNVAMVSLGDLGESKSVRPDETNELFAGTTECHELAAEFLGSFGVPYEVVGGNHGTSFFFFSFFGLDHCIYVELNNVCVCIRRKTKKTKVQVQYLYWR